MHGCLLRSVTPTRACGIIGIYKAAGDCNVEVYEGLLSLQVLSALCVSSITGRHRSASRRALSSSTFPQHTC